MHPDDGDDIGAVSALNIPMEEFVLACPNASTRLMNAIRCAAHEGTLPFRTIADYLAAGHVASERMLKLPNLGRKSATELDVLIHEVVNTPQPAKNQLELIISYQATDQRISSDFDISLDEFLNRQARVSTRLANTIRTSVADGICPFLTVTEYVQAKDGYLQLCGLPNLGQGSAVEFDELVKDALVRGSTYPVASNSYIGENGWRPNVEALIQTVFSALESKELDILLDRIQSEQTLEQVAANFAVTRERIRQIESRAIKRLRRAFGETLQDCIASLCNRLAQAGINECSLVEFAELASCDMITAQLFFSLVKRLDLPNAGHLILIDSHVILPDQFIPRQDWNAAIKRSLMAVTWPIELDALIVNCPTVPRFFIEKCLEDRYSAKISDGQFEILPSLSTADMCTHVLLKAHKPLHISEMRALAAKYFGKDIPEHLVNATAGRLKEVAIAAPGTYVHYVSLSYSDQVLAHIRHVVHRHLAEQSCFIGSKVLFDRLFLKHTSAYPEGFNHYLMMGIVQDDERFVTKRGNMVGLASFDLQKTYISLEDEVRNIILSDGPISIPEIVARLASTRKLCNDSGVRLILSHTPTIIQVGRRTYDSLHRFFTSREEYDDLVTAIQVNLLFRPKSVYALSQELISLGFARASTEVVESLLNAMDDINKTKDAYTIKSARQELCSYRDISSKCLADGADCSILLARLQEYMPLKLAERMVRLDYRLSLSRNDEAETVNTSELSSILDEFDF